MPDPNINFASFVLSLAATAAVHVEDRVTLAGPARVQYVHRGGGPAQQLCNPSRAAAQRGPDQHALDALVFHLAVGALEPVGQSRNGGFVACDQTLHPRLLVVRGTT